MPDDVWRKWHKTVRDWVGHGPSPYEAFCAGHNAARASPSAQRAEFERESADAQLLDNTIAAFKVTSDRDGDMRLNNSDVAEHLGLLMRMRDALKSAGKEST